MLISSTMPGGELPSFVSYLRSMSRSAMSCWLRRLCLRTTNLPRLVWQSGINVERASLMCDDRTEDYDHRKHEQHLPPGCARRNTCRPRRMRPLVLRDTRPTCYGAGRGAEPSPTSIPAIG